MKLERASEYLTTAVVLGAGMIFAVIAGRFTAQGQVNLILTLFLVLFATGLMVTLRGGIWLLLPAFWVMTGRVPVLPLPFALRDLVVLFTVSSFFVLIALKVVRRKPEYDLLDLLVFIMLLYLASAFIRNPVGTYAMGSARVGGKPYFDVFIAVLSYLVLIRCSMPVSWASKIPFVFSFGPWAQAILGVITFSFPSTVPILSQVYTGINTTTYDAQGLENGVAPVEDRQSHLGYVANTLILMLCSYFRPLSTLTPLHFGRFVVLCIAAFAALKSGHRSVILEFGMLFLVASYFHRGWGDVFRLLWIGVPLVAILTMLQGNVIELPKAGQRALSFLPGNWDEAAVQDAEHSTQWRVEMWKTVLTTDKYIENKVLGDGFGFSLREFEAMQAALSFGADASQENFMRSGTFHSGPISTIRVIGYVGLVMYLVLLFLMMKRGIELTRRAKDTPFFAAALFICLPIITEPARYILIFGAFDVSLPNTLFSLGLLKVLKYSLDEYYETKPSVAEIGRRLALKWRHGKAVEPVFPNRAPKKLVS